MKTTKSCLIVVLCFVVGMAFSWALTVGMIKLITLCFGWGFSLSMATGIWLIECLVFWVLKGLFPNKKKEI